MTKKIRAKMKAPTSDELDKVLNEIKDLNDGQFSVNTNHSCLLEMAEVGKFVTKRGQFILYVWSRDGGYVPHFHIGDAETYPKCEKFQCCLKIQAPEYFAHGGKYTDKLNAKQLDDLIKYLHSDDEDGDSVWRYLLKTWNKNNSNITVPLDSPIPDYAVLK